ncbi:MAG: Do family serine endopeptidase [Bacteroidales bacterium]|nr:Do family serine endopeptidase [Bacteroidales bacterium]
MNERRNNMKQALKTIVLAVAVSTLTLFLYDQIKDQDEPKVVLKEVPQNIGYQTAYLPTSKQLMMDFNSSAENALHAVVHIQTEFTRKSSVYDDFFSLEDFFFNGGNRVYKASGSGVIISSDGYIVTNNHVVQQADKITVILNDKRSYEAKTIGLDASTDLALLKVEDKELPYLTFGNSDSVKVGEWVLAVGNPFNLTSTVTAGIVSAKARNINILPGNSAIESFIQTDAAVNPGNSGGALVNIEGKLIGINAAIASRTGYYQGYSFAIPSGIVKKVVKDLKEFGQVQRAVIGISIAEINAKVAEAYKLKNLKGVLVEGVVDGLPAEKAGIKAGDIILEIDNIEINSPSELLERVGMHRPGDAIEVKYLQKDNEKTSTVKLTDMKGNTKLRSAHEEAVLELGANLKPVDEKTKSLLGIENGVQVTEIKRGIIANAGIKDDFIITKIDRKPVNQPDDIYKLLSTKKGGVLIEGIYPNGIKAYYGIGL